MLRKLSLLLTFLIILACNQSDHASSFSHGVAAGGQGGGASLQASNLFGAASSVQPSSYYTPGTGNPAVSTADYYHIDGLYWWRPYDLNAMGTPGQTIAATRGRYVWLASPDHQFGYPNWSAGQDIAIGYSNDPGVPPSRMDSFIVFNNSTVVPAATSGTRNMVAFHVPFLVYNPDDLVNGPFYVYFEATDAGGTGSPVLGLVTGLVRSTDLLSWTIYPFVTHPTTTFNGWSAYQNVTRNGTGDWYSFGNIGPTVYNGQGSWMSTDGLAWTTTNTPRTDTRGNSLVVFQSSPVFSIGAQLWTYVNEDAYDRPLPDANAIRIGQYATRVPLDANHNWQASPAAVRVSSKYDGVFPGPTFMQSVSAYIEDGVAHVWVTHGWFASAPVAFKNQGVPGTLTAYAKYENNGGLWQQNVDYYTEIVNATTAAQAAPVGVVASAANGAVTLTWYDALPNRTYRVYRGNVAAQTALVGDVNAVTITDNSAPQNQVNYYKVVTLQSGTERGNRIVSTFVSSSTAFVNAHITRALAAGADFGTIDRAWLDTFDAWLTTNSLQTSLLFSTDPGFGVVKNSSGVITKIMDLGTTRLPRGGDYTPCTGSPCTGTSTTTYDPLKLNGNAPAWTNVNANSFGYYGGAGTTSIPGHINNIRRKTQITYVVAYQKPGTGIGTFFGSNEFTGSGGRMTLHHTAGTPGDVTFEISDATHTVTATRASSSATGIHVAAGVFDGTNVIAYSDGVAGTGVTGLVVPGAALNSGGNNDTLTGQTGTGTTLPFLGSGSQNSKYTYGVGYQFSDSQAQFSVGMQTVFEKALTPTQVASLTTLITNRITPPAAVTYNIATDFSATCNGTGNDSAAFATFRTTAIAQQAGNPGLVVLNIPQGATCVFNSGGSGLAFGAGIKQLRVVGLGTGATLSNGGVNTNSGFFLGSGGCTQNGANGTASAYIATVAAGSSTVTLSTPSQHSLFTVGDLTLVAGIDRQGGGQPPNPGFYEWKRITAKNTGTGVITFSTPLRNAYKSTWPVYFAGSAGTPDQGGPALLYALNQDCDTAQEYVNLTIAQTGTPTDPPATNSNGRDITFKNVTMTGSNCAIPSQNETWRVIKSTMTNCAMEVDKIVTTLLIQNTTIKTIDIQSAITNLVLDNVTVSTGLTGTAVNNDITDSTIANFAPGARCCGASTGPLNVSNTSIATISNNNGAVQSFINSRGTWASGTLIVPPNTTVSAAANNGSGLIRLTVASTTGYSTGIVTDVGVATGSASCSGTWPVTVIDGTRVDLQGSTFSATCTGTMGSLPLAWAAPGANVYWASRDIAQGPMLQVNDLTQSASGTSVSFNQAGAAYTGVVPTMALNTPPPTNVQIKVHPAPQFTCTTCTGSAEALALSRAPPGLPLWSYFDQTYVSATTPFLVPIWGVLTNLSIAVNVAGNSGSGFNLDGPFIDIVNTTTRTQYIPTLNGAITGTRNTTQTTATGGQSGDSWSAPGAGAWWVPDQMTPKWSGTVGSGSVRVIMSTNQGVVN